MFTCKKELEAAEQSLDAVRNALDFSDEGGSIFKDSENDESRYLTERYVKENFEINTPSPNPAVIPESESFAVNEVKHRIPVLDPPRSSLNPAAVWFVSPNKICDNDALELAKVVVKNQMIPQRLWKFNGEPARYVKWKHSFLSVMEDINEEKIYDGGKSECFL